MRKQKLTIVLLILMLSAAALAADLKNEDVAKYEIKIYKSEGRVETKIEGGTTLSQICSEYEIEVVGVDKAKISGSEIWIIKDAKLSKQE